MGRWLDRPEQVDGARGPVAASPSRPLAHATGILLVIGLIVAPGIVMGLDDMDTAPWWVWVGYVGWLGIFVLLPIWSIWLALPSAAHPMHRKSGSGWSPRS